MKRQVTKLISLGVALALATTAVSAETDTMEVMIMGSGSPNYNPDRASAGVLIRHGDTDILVDMGSGVRANLYRAEVADNKLDALMFTHHHMDHDADFTAIMTRAIIGRDPVMVYGSVGTEKFLNNFLDFYGEDLNYRLSKSGRTLEARTETVTSKDLKSGDTFNIGDIKVSALEVPHTIETLAYRFDYDGQSVVITGDLTYTDKLAPFAKDADYMIIDSGGIKMVKGTELKRRKFSNIKLPPAHLNLAQSSKIAGDAQVKNLVYTHFLPGTVDEEASLAVIRENYDGKVTFSEDLMTLSCSPQ